MEKLTMLKLRKSVFAMIALTVLTTLPAAAAREDDADRKSKNGKTTGTIAGTEVTIEYGRPSVRERQIWGELVPNGKVWRTGADEATTITFGADVVVEGQALTAGTYSLFTIPGDGEWTIILNRTAEQWGAYDYDAGQDALRVTVTPQSGDHVETMDFIVDEHSFALRWGKLVVPVRVSSAS